MDDTGASLLNRLSGRQPAGAGVRILILGWCLWLLGSWAVAINIEPAMARATRWMVFAAVLGLMVIWPTFRLSQGNGGGSPSSRSPQPVSGTNHGMSLGGVFVDWFCLLVVFQAVIWPLRILKEWSIQQAVLLDLVVSVWSLLTGLLIAYGCRFRRGSARGAVLGLCILLLLGEPAMMMLTPWGRPPGQLPWTMRISPIQILWALTDRPEKFDADRWISTMATAATVAVIGWAFAGAETIISRRRRLVQRSGHAELC